MNSDITTRKFLVITQDGEHEFNIIVTQQIGSFSRKYEMLTSNSDIWAEDYKNKLLLEMTDTGDGILFDRDIKDIGYDTASYVRILMTFDSKTFSVMEEKFKIIEENAIIEI